MAALLSPTLSVQVRSAPRELGGMLAPGSATVLPRGPYGAVFVIAGGLSASAVREHAVPMVMATTARLLHWNLGPVVLAEYGGVASGDEIGALMNAAMVVVLIGERARLTGPESLSAYLTRAPKVGRRDSERHCISNIHHAGLSYAAAAHKLESLMSRGHSADTDDDPSKSLGPDSIDKLLDSEPSKLRSSTKLTRG
jgi:ethanolamine ammonia-lyase small subunit